MQPALTGGAVNISGGYHDYGKGSYNFLYCYHFIIIIIHVIFQGAFLGTQGHHTEVYKKH